MLTICRPVSFAMLTLYLSRRDQRRATERRASVSPSEVSEDIVLEDESDADSKKSKLAEVTEVTNVPVPVLASEYRCATTLA